MTRILHTSDWHLGATLEGLPRDEDHRLFLDWLARAIPAERIDVLVVAGDVFDQAQPSADAQRLYYQFLRKVSDSLGAVVVVGGNHDSASRLDAPRDILAALHIHVVGGLSADRASWDRCLCPIRDRNGSVACVIAAAPFVHEFRLGVRTALRDESEIRASFIEAFGSFYRDLADRAQSRWPSAPLVTTGHLAAEGATRKDAPAETHMIGTIGALPATIFDARFSYVALGHVHRSYHVGGSRAWYCGTPIPLNLAEAQSPRQVLVFDTDDPQGKPSSVVVPSFRRLVKISGELDHVKKSLRSLEWDGPLAPFVCVEVEVDRYAPGLEAEVIRAAEANPRGGMRVLQPRQVPKGGAAKEPVPTMPSLAELKPEQVFTRLCEARGEQPDDHLMNAFRSLLSEVEEEPS
jgi:exonuclease SbcD